jgi:hypothetical protein
MASAVAQDVQVMRYALLDKDIAEPPVFLQAHIRFSGCENDSQPANFIQESVIIDVGKKVRRVMEVAIFVIVPVDELVNVKSPPKGD